MNCACRAQPRKYVVLLVTQATRNGTLERDSWLAVVVTWATEHCCKCSWCVRNSAAYSAISDAIRSKFCFYGIVHLFIALYVLLFFYQYLLILNYNMC